MSDDIIKRLREAIAAGPTPGPWMHLVGDRLIYTKLGDGCKGEAVARVDWISGPSYLATLSFIAAASPDNIRALLDRLKDLESNGSQAVRWAPSSAHWSSELRRLFGADARDGIDALEQRLRDAEAENERLRESLRGLLAVTSSKAPGTGLIVGAEDRHAAAIKQARAALEV